MPAADGSPAPARGPLDVPDTVPREQMRFRADVRQALDVWRRHPALPLMSAVLGVVTAVSGSSSPAAVPATVVLVVFAGWVGAERLWYLRAFTGRTMGPVEALRWSLRYFGRFFRLALLLAVAAVPLMIPVMVAVSDAARGARSEGDVRLGVGMLVYAWVVWLVLDFALTFVTPALVFTTDSAVDAVRVGGRLVRATWPHAAAYVLLPPLAIVMLTRLSSGPVALLGGVVVTASALLSLLARGATCALYLRVMAPAGPDGAQAGSTGAAPRVYSAYVAT